MTAIPWLLVFSQLAGGALHSFNVQTAKQPLEHRSSFMRWCCQTQFVKVFDAGLETLE